MQEYHFKIQFDRFFAKLAVDGGCSLYDLAKLINRAVGFDFDHAFEFCDNLAIRIAARSATRCSLISARRPTIPE